jgi:hypothetical protein
MTQLETGMMPVGMIPRILETGMMSVGMIPGILAGWGSCLN